MLISEGLPFIKDYVESLDNILRSATPPEQLSFLQKRWLSFVILGVLVTNSLCWKKLERYSLGLKSCAALSWMFCRSRIAFSSLLYCSALKIMRAHNITKGYLVIDDTDIRRSKNTQKIGKAHKIMDKKTSGYINGQNIIFLVFVTEKVTIPVGFEFFAPDENLREWGLEDKRLRQSKMKKKDRPSRPDRDPEFPPKKELAWSLVEEFARHFPDIQIKAVIADALYNTKDFFDKTSSALPKSQIISQLKSTQNICVGGKYKQVKEHFRDLDGSTQTITLRHSDKQVTFASGKFKVKSHDKKYFVVAVKYDNEEEYRYLLANKMTWGDIDIIKAYALRWLVEVFIQDWKSYEGWDKLAMQQGIDGSEKGLTISLLVDHALLFHKEQRILCENNDKAVTVGSLREKVMMESLTAFIETIISDDNPTKALQQISDRIAECFQLRESDKHMRQMDFDIIGEKNDIAA